MANPPRSSARPIACPRCGLVRTMTASPGTRLRCPRCRVEYSAPRPEKRQTPSPEPTPKPAPAPPAARTEPVPAGVVGPTVIDVPAVTIRPAPPPKPGLEPPAAPESAETSQNAAAPRADENGKPPEVHTLAGRDRRPIRRLRP